MSEQEEDVSLRSMYADYFLDYASYVILERAVPHVLDGLKPVQRRILHSLNEMDDGRYNKVANVVGNTMKYHPHGEASIGEAIVSLGQRDLLIDTQGNWGNILTGDRAAASRYIEARLTPFAKEISFNPKTTEWTNSYDGRNKEPVSLPVKFPLLLAQGVEGIAVGLACKVLPHNFNELIDACIAALRNEKVEIFPDFFNGGMADVTDYRDGVRGGKIRVRAKIEIENKKTLRISEIPFGTTTGALMENIVAANDKGKIKIASIVDNTAAKCEIIVNLAQGAEPQMAIDALYAFTECEISISPNACVIVEGKPQFLGVSDILKINAAHTKNLIQKELEIKLGDFQEKWHFSSLEKIFIENRIYRKIENCETWEAVIKAIDTGLKPHVKNLKRAVTEEDIVRLTEIRIKRISKFDSFKADEAIADLEKAIAEVEKNLSNLTRFTINYFNNLKIKYGLGRERRTELKEFTKVDRANAVMITETLYLNAKEGFAGIGKSMSKDEVVDQCSTLDDIVVFTPDGVVKVMRVADKLFVGKRPLYVSIFRKNEDKVYSLIYRDGRDGPVLVKRFKMGGVIRDTEYVLTKGTVGSRVMYFAVHNTEEESSANSVMIHLKPQLRLKQLSLLFHFSELAVKGRSAAGNLITKHAVDRIVRAGKNSDGSNDFELVQ
jgi:topoisomerase IV subunit A